MWLSFVSTNWISSRSSGTLAGSVFGLGTWPVAPSRFRYLMTRSAISSASLWLRSPPFGLSSAMPSRKRSRIRMKTSFARSCCASLPVTSRTRLNLPDSSKIRIERATSPSRALADLRAVPRLGLGVDVLLARLLVELRCASAISNWPSIAYSIRPRSLTLLAARISRPAWYASSATTMIAIVVISSTSSRANPRSSGGERRGRGRGAWRWGTWAAWRRGQDTPARAWTTAPATSVRADAPATASAGRPCGRPRRGARGRGGPGRPCRPRSGRRRSPRRRGSPRPRGMRTERGSFAHTPSAVPA